MEHDAEVFMACLDLIFKLEGYDRVTDDEHDTGGLTKWGISQAAFPDRDIRNLTKQDAIEIYYKSYWQAASCGSLPYPVALIVFDCAVNQGVGASVKLLQESVGTPADGIVGPKTLRCVARMEVRELVLSYMIQRVKRYFGTRGFDRFGRGWMNRVVQVTALAAEWAGKT